MSTLDCPPSPDSILDQVRDLPSIPQILPKLLTALGEPDTDVDAIADLIAYDPALTVKVLQLCNSPAMGRAGAATDVSEAIAQLGLKRVYLLVAALNCANVIRPARPILYFDSEQIWKHSVITALAAQLLAKDLGVDESAAFTAGLLHNVGRVALASAFPETYGELSRTHANSPADLQRAERESYGFDSGEIGGHLLTRWAFPKPLAAGVTYQLRPADAGDYARAAAVLNLAGTLATMTETPPPDDHPAPTPNADALLLLLIGPESLPLYCERILENFEFINALCRT